MAVAHRSVWTAMLSAMIEPIMVKAARDTHILRRLHSAQAWGVVIRLAPVAPVGFPLSWESLTGFRGVTPWKV